MDFFVSDTRGLSLGDLESSFDVPDVTGSRGCHRLPPLQGGFAS